jgi:hypothetical protein
VGICGTDLTQERDYETRSVPDRRYLHLVSIFACAVSMGGHSSRTRLAKAYLDPSQTDEDEEDVSEYTLLRAGAASDFRDSDDSDDSDNDDLALGIKSEGLPVRWRDLDVYGTGTGEELVRTLPVAAGLGFGNWAAKLCRRWIRGVKQEQRKLIENMQGIVEQVN